MTDEAWENGLRQAMSGTADRARVVTPPTDAILRRGRSSARWRTGLAGSGVLGVVAAAVIAGTSLGLGTGTRSVAGSAAQTSAPPIEAADAVVVMGSATAKTKVQIYDDYRCPPCREIDNTISPLLKQEVGAGLIQVEYRSTDLIDKNGGGTGSVIAGNAVQCAAEHGDFYSYRSAVFAHQPSSTSHDVFDSSAQLIAIAREIPGLDDSAFEKCVTDQPYAIAIRRNYDHAINTLQCRGVPCILLDGQQWQVPGAGDMRQAFASQLSQAEGAHVS
jgi:protein-disulfide isomerase